MEEKVILELKPNFNLLYEFFMPTGKRIRFDTLFLLIIIILLVVINFLPNASFAKVEVLGDMALNQLASIVLFILVAAICVKLVIDIVIQVLQYRSIRYLFYENYVEYVDSFLNQHKRMLKYADIKEMEIRRTIWDRINGCGIIVLYTNAEKNSSVGLIIYAVKNPDELYTKIDEIIHSEQNKEQQKQEDNEEKTDRLQQEKSFKDSLR